MHLKRLLLILSAAWLPLSAAAAGPAYLTLDLSSPALIDKAGAQSVWQQQLTPALSARLVKLYPPRRWGYLSQVEGGFNADKACVVTARAMLLPRSGKTVAFAPEKSATTFDAKPGASQDDCRALARAKLAEAVEAVTAGLVR